MFSLRSDYLDQLDIGENFFGRDPLRNRFRLHKLGLDTARAAILEPAKLFDFGFESILVDQLILDLEQVGIAPSHLQIVCFFSMAKLEKFTKF